MPSIILLGCGQITSDEPKIEEQLIGKWKFNSRNSIAFTKDGRYNWFRNDQLETQIHYKGNVYNQLYYDLRKEGNTKLLSVYGKEPKQVLYNYKFEIEGEVLYLVSLKSLPGITHHIDELSYCFKGETLKSEIGEVDPVLQIIFPYDFRGLALIAFEEKEGTPEVISDNLEILNIPSNGLLNTQSNSKPFAFLQKEVVYYRAAENGILEKIEISPDFSYSPEQFKKGLDSSAVYVVNYGFNQIDRRRINSQLFQSEVHNDVLFLGVGSPDELSEIWSKLLDSIEDIE